MTYEDAAEMWQSENETQELAFVVEAEQREAHQRFMQWLEASKSSSQRIKDEWRKHK